MAVDDPGDPPPAPAGDRSRRDRVLPWIVPALLVVVGVTQVVRARTLDQSSWSGVGFGMFATIDSEITRRAVVHLESPDGTTRQVALPPGVEAERERAAVTPTRANLDALAAAVQQRLDTDDAVRVELVSVAWDADEDRVSIVRVGEGTTASTASPPAGPMSPAEGVP